MGLPHAGHSVAVARGAFDRADVEAGDPRPHPGVFVATLLHVALTVASRMATYWIVGRTAGSWLQEAQRMFFQNFDWEMMTYWAIVGLSHALRYQREARDRELSGAQLETHLVEAQLQALQRQLQPHFLFNTLNTISALMHRDVDAADDMIARLSDLLRISLQTVGVQEVTLKEELDFLSKYLEIEQTRFRDRLTVVFDVHPDTLDALVPNLVLQPLVENAIKHGIGPRPTPGQIEIRARNAGALLELEVQDNGVGLSAARLTDFNRGVGLVEHAVAAPALVWVAASFRIPAACRGRVAGAHRHSAGGACSRGERRRPGRGGCGVSKIRTMVVDDEPVARERIIGLLKQEKDIELVGEYADGAQAIKAIQQQHPDLVFLDVQMPACDGFGVHRAGGRRAGCRRWCS